MMHGTMNVKVRITLAGKGSATVYFKSVEKIEK
jgi:hypothetical protein